MASLDAFSQGLVAKWREVQDFAESEVQRLKEENDQLTRQIEKLTAGCHYDVCQSPATHQPEAEPLALECHNGGATHTAALTRAPTRTSTGTVITENEVYAKIKLDMKKRDRSAQHVTDVSDFYKKEGMWQRIARHPVFENVTLAVVVFNGFWIAIDVDFNTGDPSQAVWPVMDNLFCVYFTAEVIIRFFAFEHKCDAFKNAWFDFDMVLVLMMVGETWLLPLVALISGMSTDAGGNAQVLRLLRLLRLTRMAKMMRSVPELLILIKGTIVGIRSVTITLVLLGAITFVFAIAMRTLTSGTEVGDENFGTVPGSAYTLIVQGVIPDNGDLMSALGEEKWYYGVLFFAFIFLAALTFMNMLIGILCEAVHGVSVDENEEMDLRHMRDMIESRLLGMRAAEEERGELTEWAADEPVTVTRDNFIELMDDDEVCEALLKIDCDVLALVEKITHYEEYHRHFDDFIDEVKTFRATDANTVKVMFEVRKNVEERCHHLERAILHMGREIKKDTQSGHMMFGELKVIHNELAVLLRGNNPPAPKPDMELSPAGAAIDSSQVVDATVSAEKNASATQREDVKDHAELANGTPLKQAPAVNPNFVPPVTIGAVSNGDSCSAQLRTSAISGQTPRDGWNPTGNYTLAAGSPMPGDVPSGAADLTFALPRSRWQGAKEVAEDGNEEVEQEEESEATEDSEEDNGDGETYDLNVPEDVPKLGLSFNQAKEKEKEVCEVKGGSLAESEGVEVGDKVIEINGKDARNIPMADALKLLKERPLQIKMLRPAQEMEGDNTPCEDAALDAQAQPLLQ